MENGTYEQIVTHLEKELELNGLEAPDELQVNNVSRPTNTNSQYPNQRATTVKNLDITEIGVACWKNPQYQTDKTQISPGNKNSGANNSQPNRSVNKNNKNNKHKNSNRAKRKPKIVYPPCETCGKTN